MLKKVLIAALLVVVGIAAAGVYKFNILDDDLYLAPTQDNLTGSWLEVGPIPGQDLHAGFELRDDGSAASINAATLRYRNWSLAGDRLTLQEISIGNGATSEAPVAYRVLSLTLDGNQLALISDDGAVSKYRRENPEQRAANTRYEAE